MRTVLVSVGRLGLALLVAGAAAACGGGEQAGEDERPQIVVTTSILGDVVGQLVGDAAAVEVIMPRGSDPHEFAPSAQQALALREADVVVANGLGFEVGLVDTLEAVEEDGGVVLTATDAVTPLALPTAGDGAGELDPHFFTDPARMRAAAAFLADGLAEQVPALATPDQATRTARYLDELAALDAEVEALVATIPPARRVLVTNHEVFGYFADRYGFEVLGAVLPGGSTLAEPSAADLARLADQIQETGVPAIFAETSSPTRLAEALAGEGHGVEVVELYSEALGEPGSDGATYVEMVRTNARRIAAALG